MDAKNRQFSVYIKEKMSTPECKSVLRTDNIRGKMFVCISEFISVLRADKIGGNMLPEFKSAFRAVTYNK